MKCILRLLNSRRFAAWLLIVMVAALVFSTLLPNEITKTPEEWALLKKENPFFFRLASTFSTPYLVKTPLFTITVFSLFLSILVCTVARIQNWRKRRESEFTKEKAFSFAMEGEVHDPPAGLGKSMRELLEGRGWECSDEDAEGKSALFAQKGIRLSFWGSIVFHIGMFFCFIAVPVSAVTRFNGVLILTEGATLPLMDVLVTTDNRELSKLPTVDVAVRNLRGVYAKGRFKYDFGGDLVVSRDGHEEIFPFSVNNPVNYAGFQFSLQEYGFSPRVMVAKGGKEVFDYFLNLRNPQDGDYFRLGNDTRLFVLFFPDFSQDGNRIVSRSRDPRNPRLLLGIEEGGRMLHRRLLTLGEETGLGDYAVSAPELKNWVSLAVSREQGLNVLVLGMIIGIAGLLVRFVSNERRLELEIFLGEGRTAFRLRGYSRYYPAFLEKEVGEMAGRLKERLRGGGSVI